MGTNLNVIVVGDGWAGKTSFLMTYIKQSFPAEYKHTVLNEFNSNFMVDGQPVCLKMWDMTGLEDYDKIRNYFYPTADGFIICFSVENPNFENIEAKWIPEIRRLSPHAPVILVACKIDLRKEESCINLRTQLSTYEDGAALAEKLGVKYCEISALNQEGLNSCIEEAVRCPAPKIEKEASTYGDDLYKMLKNPMHTDVTFVLEGEHKLEAHKLILSSASEIFEHIFSVNSSKQKIQLQQDNHDYTTAKLNSGAVPGIAMVYDTEDNGIIKTTVQINEDIAVKTFVNVLEFLYTGVLKCPDLDEIGITKIKDLKRVAGIFNLPSLQTICSNMLTERDFLNLDVGTNLNKQKGANMKKLFLNQPEFSDVKFLVEGETVFAHKCVLCMRNKVMAAMFGGDFKEVNRGVSQIKLPETSYESFLAFLEYLYTNNATIEETYAFELLVLADKYGETRLLNLCEQFIADAINKPASTAVKKSDIDVINLLFEAQQVCIGDLQEIGTGQSTTSITNLQTYASHHRQSTIISE